TSCRPTVWAVFSSVLPARPWVLRSPSSKTSSTTSYVAVTGAAHTRTGPWRAAVCGRCTEWTVSIRPPATPGRPVRNWCGDHPVDGRKVAAAREYGDGTDEGAFEVRRAAECRTWFPRHQQKRPEPDGGALGGVVDVDAVVVDHGLRRGHRAGIGGKG